MDERRTRILYVGPTCEAFLEIHEFLGKPLFSFEKSCDTIDPAKIKKGRHGMIFIGLNGQSNGGVPAYLDSTVKKLANIMDTVDFASATKLVLALEGMDDKLIKMARSKGLDGVVQKTEDDYMVHGQEKPWYLSELRGF